MAARPAHPEPITATFIMGKTIILLEVDVVNLFIIHAT